MLHPFLNIYLHTGRGQTCRQGEEVAGSSMSSTAAGRSSQSWFLPTESQDTATKCHPYHRAFLSFEGSSVLCASVECCWHRPHHHVGGTSPAAKNRRV
jgi:hypothetical protein